MSVTGRLLAEDFARKLPGLPGLSPIDAANFAAVADGLVDALRLAADPATPAWKVSPERMAANARWLAHKAQVFGLIEGAR